jgi:hypothetical protein
MDAMRAAEVLARLIEIERAIGVEDPLRVREMVMEAQECVLEIQKAAADRLQNERLAPDRLAMIAPRHSALSFALDGERV